MFKAGYFAPFLLLLLAACDNSSPPPSKPSALEAAQKITPVKSQAAEPDFGDCREHVYGPWQEDRTKACGAIIDRNTDGKAVLSEAYRRRADAYYQMKDFERAIADLAAALEITPDNAKAYYTLGAVYSRKEDTEHAIADYTKAIDLDPKYVDAYEARARLHKDKGNAEQAQADGQRVIDIRTEEVNKQPKNAWSYVIRSCAYKEAGDPAHAVGDLSKAIELAPLDGDIFGRRGELYRSIGKHDHAMADLFRAIEIKPQWPPSIYGYTHYGYHTRAIALLSRRLEIEPTDTTALAQRGESYLALGKLDHATADAFKFVELAPDNALAYLQRADVYEARGERPKAIADLSRSIQIQATWPWPHIRRGKIFEASGDSAGASADYAAAIEILTRRIDTDKTPDTDDLLARAEAFEIKRDYDRAMEDVAKAIEQAPKWPGSYELRARLLERKGDREAMAADYQKAVALLSEPDTPSDFSERARLYLLARQPAKGLPDAESSLELQPGVPAVLDIRGRLLEALGRREEAIADFRRALAKRPDLRTSSEALKRLAAGP
jgi:tetratricopeptide (TPR) repeat protein